MAVILYIGPRIASVYHKFGQTESTVTFDVELRN